MKLKHPNLVRQFIIIGIIFATGAALIFMNPNRIVARSNAEYDFWESDAAINFDPYTGEQIEMESDSTIPANENEEVPAKSSKAGTPKNEISIANRPNKTTSSSAVYVIPDESDTDSSKIVSSKTDSSKKSSSKTSSRKTSSRKTSSRKPTSSKTTSSKVNSSKPTSSKVSSNKPISSSDNTPVSSKEPPYTGMVSINNGTFEQLCSLDGIGEVIAQRIIDFREQSGGFTDIEELKYVKGIGEQRFENIKDRLTL